MIQNLIHVSLYIYFLIFHTRFRFGQQQLLFIYVDFTYWWNQIIHIICEVHTRTHTQTHPIHFWIIEYSIALLMYKMTKCMMPSLFENMFIKTCDVHDYPDSKVHGVNMGPIWVLSAPDGLHVGPTNLAIRVFTYSTGQAVSLYFLYVPSKTRRTLRHYGTKLRK